MSLPDLIYGSENMRYGLISDIHGNLEALEAALGDLAKERIDEYLCIGDIVGYGANPRECIKIVRELELKALIAGNHEWGVLGFLDIDYFNEYAREAILWTKNILNHHETDYLKSFKLSWSEGCMTLVHGSLEEPQEFYYIFDPKDADKTLKLQKTQLCFVGHSHMPGIFYSDGKVANRVNSLKTRIEADKRYVINIGSIGQPRDGDPRASFAVYDEDEGIVEIKRVPYDIERAQAKILATGLPTTLALRLAEGH